MMRGLAHTLADVLDALAATSWRDWFLTIAEFVGAAFAIASIFIFCVALAML